MFQALVFSSLGSWRHFKKSDSFMMGRCVEVCAGRGCARCVCAVVLAVCGCATLPRPGGRTCARGQLQIGGLQAGSSQKSKVQGTRGPGFQQEQPADSRVGHRMGKQRARCFYRDVAEEMESGEAPAV